MDKGGVCAKGRYSLTVTFGNGDDYQIGPAAGESFAQLAPSLMSGIRRHQADAQHLGLERRHSRLDRRLERKMLPSARRRRRLSRALEALEKSN